MSEQNGMLRLDPLAIVNTPATEEKPKANSSVNVGTLEQMRLSGQPLSLGSAFVTQDQAAREADLSDQGLRFEAGLGEDLRQDYDPNNQFTTGAMGEVMRSGQKADFKNLVDQGTVNRLAEMGLQADYKQDKYKGYRYNPNTGAYDYYDNTPSMLEQAAPALIKAGVMGAATGGLGGALSSSLGIGTGMGKALASAGLNAFMGESVDLESIAKNMAVSYGMDKLEGLTDVIDTGNEFANDILKDTIGSIAKGEDPKKAAITSILKQGGDYVADALDLSGVEDSFLGTLSDFDKEYLQPFKNYVEESLGVDFSEAYDEIKGDIDGFLDKVPDEIKDIVEGFAKYKLGEATGMPMGESTGVATGTPMMASLDNPLIDTQGELTQYESLDNNLLEKLRI